MAFPLTTEDYMSFLTELERRLGEDSMDKGGGESLVNFLTGLRFLLQSRETIRKLPLTAALTRFRHGIERQENTVTLMHAVKAAAFSASERRATGVRVDSLAEISFSSCEEADELWAAIAKRWIACICDAALQH